MKPSVGRIVQYSSAKGGFRVNWQAAIVTGDRCSGEVQSLVDLSVFGAAVDGCAAVLDVPHEAFAGDLQKCWRWPPRSES